MAHPCNNANCPRASWCKGFTYKWKPGTQREYLICSSENNWLYYTKNKAREIYERDNPNDILRNEELNQQEHQDNNRESRMREDHEADTRTGGEGVSWRFVEPNNLLFPYSSSDTRSTAEVLGYLTELGRQIEGQSIIDGGDEGRVSATDDVLQDVARSGVLPPAPGADVSRVAEESDRFLQGHWLYTDLSRERRLDLGEIQSPDEG